MIGLWLYLSMSTGCVALLRRDWVIFYHAGSGRADRVGSAREKSLVILHNGWDWTRGQTGRTDSEIHSFSHWAIMTPATGRTDSEIYLFSHWPITASLGLLSRITPQSERKWMRKLFDFTKRNLCPLGCRIVLDLKASWLPYWSREPGKLVKTTSKVTYFGHNKTNGTAKPENSYYPASLLPNII